MYRTDTSKRYVWLRFGATPTSAAERFGPKVARKSAAGPSYGPAALWLR
jgi:hypothetical protein